MVGCENIWVLAHLFLVSDELWRGRLLERGYDVVVGLVIGQDRATRRGKERGTVRGGSWARLFLIADKLWRGRLLERGSERGDGVVVGAALVSRENRGVDWALEVIHDLLACGQQEGKGVN
jgi:hypothetical protein